MNYFFKNNNPKGYKKINEVETKRTSEINRDGYSKKKIPDDIDVIIIGSGIGGLTTGALLSKVEKKYWY